jgi:type I restriction enzyme S subunit
LRTEYKVYSAYVYYLLCNELINDLIKREATGSAQKGLNQDFVSKIVIPIIDENKIYKLNELEELRCKNIYLSKKLTLEAKQDVEDLIEGKFDMSKLNNESSTESRC